MAVVSMKQLLESGVHFGHETRRWNPKMAPYIFTSRNGIYIIDLKRTAIEIEKSYQALLKIVQDGGKVLFVGTKKQAQGAIKEEAIRTGQFYVNQRWLGGTLTNFKTIRRRIKRLHDLHKMEADGIFDKLSKKEVQQLMHQRDRLDKFLGGIKDMKKVPEAVFIIDPRKERNAILEARKLKIPIFGIVDTNCDPDEIDHIIPANDDAIRAVKLISWVMGNAIIEGQGGVVEKFADEPITSAPPRRDRPNYKPRDNNRDYGKSNYRDNSRPQRHNPRPSTENRVEAKPVVEQKTPVVKPVVEQKAAVVKPVVEQKVETTNKITEESLSSMKVTELRTLAKERKLSGYSALKKAELINLLK